MTTTLGVLVVLFMLGFFSTIFAIYLGGLLIWGIVIGLKLLLKKLGVLP